MFLMQIFYCSSATAKFVSVVLKYYTCQQHQKHRSKYSNLLDFQNALLLLAENHLSNEKLWYLYVPRNTYLEMISDSTFRFGKDCCQQLVSEIICSPLWVV